MPYITEAAKNKIDDGRRPETPGELNYAITLLLTDWLVTMGTSYQSMNDALGALEGAKLEFYRRVVAPYEDKKIRENGDVYR